MTHPSLPAPQRQRDPEIVRTGRRSLLRRLLAGALFGSPLAALGSWLVLGTCAALPRTGKPRRWFVGTLGDLRAGRLEAIRTPAGLAIGIREEAGALYALSTRCPHLGCQVRWIETNQRYECPCHGATFDPEGEMIGGPLRRGSRLERYQTTVEGDRIYLEVPAGELRRGAMVPGALR